MTHTLPQCSVQATVTIKFFTTPDGQIGNLVEVTRPDEEAFPDALNLAHIAIEKALLDLKERSV